MHWRLLTAPSPLAAPLLKYPGKSAVSAAFFLGPEHYWEENLEGLSGGPLPLPLGAAAKSWFLARRTWWQTEKKAGRTGRAVGWGMGNGGEEGEKVEKQAAAGLAPWQTGLLLSCCWAPQEKGGNWPVLMTDSGEEVAEETDVLSVRKIYWGEASSRSWNTPPKKPSLSTRFSNMANHTKSISPPLDYNISVTRATLVLALKNTAQKAPKNQIISRSCQKIFLPTLVTPHFTINWLVGRSFGLACKFVSIQSAWSKGLDRFRVSEDYGPGEKPWILTPLALDRTGAH